KSDNASAGDCSAIHTIEGLREYQKPPPNVAGVKENWSLETVGGTGKYALGINMSPARVSIVSSQHGTVAVNIQPARASYASRIRPGQRKRRPGAKIDRRGCTPAFVDEASMQQCQVGVDVEGVGRRAG